MSGGRINYVKQFCILVGVISISKSILERHDPIAVVTGFSVISNDAAAISATRSISISGNSRFPTTELKMVSTFGNFFDDFNSRRRRRQKDGNDDADHDNDEEDSSSSAFFDNLQHEEQQRQRQEQQNHQHHNHNRNTKFVTGDDLHRLRHQVLAMRLELQEAQRYGINDDDEYGLSADPSSLSSVRKVQELERAILRTQQVDAEFVYTLSLQRKELAERDGHLDAERYHDMAMEARAALPQFGLEGLWVGKYGGSDGGGSYEMINVTYQGDTLLAHKVTSAGTNVPRGAETFRVDLSPLVTTSKSSNNNDRQSIHNNSRNPQQSYEQHRDQNNNHNHNNNDPVLSPIELGDSAAKQWGCKYLQRFAGMGQVSAEGYQDSQWMDGQLILVNEYFSFAWLPIGHQVFFGRPTPELVLKLMKDEKKKEITTGFVVDGSIESSSTSSPSSIASRMLLEKCWDETEHIHDDMELIVDEDKNFNNNNNNNDDNSRYRGPDVNYYRQDTCWE